MELFDRLSSPKKDCNGSPCGPFFLMAGPCVVENEYITLKTAEYLKSLTDKLGLPFIFKSSYRKANRSRLDSFRGIGDEKALGILAKVKNELQVPIVTDIHETHEAVMAAEVADVLQIPAFLCRQTDLLVAASNTGKIVNIKKGQFLSAGAMQFAAQKCIDSGNHRVMLTDRGNSFGYTDLIVDFRGIPQMRSFGFPVVMDITHSLQQPNQTSGVTGGLPQMIETIAKAAIAVGVDGLFLETHPNTQEALSDGANMIPLDQVESLLLKLIPIRKAL
ncbi:3-deoxy-8-phosphooctulonate synthase [Falsiporphyromonas endometrii]|uniref:3-deoxy-8-phosphooctulonate synthase n=1 Tax=Falsiporphyromonas endometrii TaxID=1387297 RepID=A0ABV9K4V6_9PORP|nr:3-deoxy-8-phosphooctulonate synthase [Porphyromonadaceae bacterium]